MFISLKFFFNFSLFLSQIFGLFQQTSNYKNYALTAMQQSELIPDIYMYENESKLINLD